MRLGCPNCDAQYEVDDTAIPASGRDVQCSNCGHTWFQLPAGAFGEDGMEPAPVARTVAPRPVRQRPAPPAASPTPTSPPATTAAPQMTPAPPPAAVAAAAVPAEDAAPAATAPRTEEVDAGLASAPARRTLDDNLMAILREEAAREAAERKAEAERAMQVQPDLGLQETPRRAAPPATFLAPDDTADDGPEPDAGTDTPAAPARGRSRRDLLPNIEEINSTLRPGGEHRSGDGMDYMAEAAVRRRGFSAGFFVVLLIAAACTLVYVLAPQITALVPTLAEPLATYVAAVDAARIGLDGALQWATGVLERLSGEAPSTPPG